MISSDDRGLSMSGTAHHGESHVCDFPAEFGKESGNFLGRKIFLPGRQLEILRNDCPEAIVQSVMILSWLPDKFVFVGIRFKFCSVDKGI